MTNLYSCAYAKNKECPPGSGVVVKFIRTPQDSALSPSSFYHNKN